MVSRGRISRASVRQQAGIQKSSVRYQKPPPPRGISTHPELVFCAIQTIQNRPQATSARYARELWCPWLPQRRLAEPIRAGGLLMRKISLIAVAAVVMPGWHRRMGWHRPLTREFKLRWQSVVSTRSKSPSTHGICPPSTLWTIPSFTAERSRGEHRARDRPFSCPGHRRDSEATQAAC